MFSKTSSTKTGSCKTNKIISRTGRISLLAAVAIAVCACGAGQLEGTRQSDFLPADTVSTESSVVAPAPDAAPGTQPVADHVESGGWVVTDSGSVW